MLKLFIVTIYDKIALPSLTICAEIMTAERWRMTIEVTALVIAIGLIFLEKLLDVAVHVAKRNLDLALDSIYDSKLQEETATANFQCWVDAENETLHLFQS